MMLTSFYKMTTYHNPVVFSNRYARAIQEEMTPDKEPIGYKLFENLVFFLIALYPIMPLNRYIGSLSYANICSILLVATYIPAAHWRFPVVNLWNNCLCFWLNKIVYILFIFITVDFIHGVSNFVTLFLVPLVVVKVASRNEESFQKTIDCVLYASLVLSCIAIYESFSGQYLIQADLGDAAQGFRYGLLRAMGPFGNPILLGLFQASAALLTVYKLNLSSKSTNKIKYELIYIGAIVSVFLTVSRLSILFLVISQGIVLLSLNRNNVVRIITLIVVVACCGIGITSLLNFDIGSLVSDLTATFSSLVMGASQKDSSVIGYGNRLQLYEWVINGVGSNWLVGLGINAPFGVQIDPYTIKTSIEVHYLFIYYQCGVLGLAILILSYIQTLVTFGRIAQRKVSYESKIYFKKIILILIITYYICLFGVQEVDLARFYCELIAIGLGYRHLISIKVGKEKNEKNKNRSCVTFN